MKPLIAIVLFSPTFGVCLDKGEYTWAALVFAIGVFCALQKEEA